jgi:hypothetical protein
VPPPNVGKPRQTFAGSTRGVICADPENCAISLLPFNDEGKQDHIVNTAQPYPSFYLYLPKGNDEALFALYES